MSLFKRKEFIPKSFNRTHRRRGCPSINQSIFIWMALHHIYSRLRVLEQITEKNRHRINWAPRASRIEVELCHATFQSFSRCWPAEDTTLTITVFTALQHKRESPHCHMAFHLNITAFTKSLTRMMDNDSKCFGVMSCWDELRSTGLSGLHRQEERLLTAPQLRN